MSHANSKQGLWAIALQDLKWKGFQQILKCLCRTIPAQTMLVPSETWEKAQCQSGNSLWRKVSTFPLVQREASEHSYGVTGNKQWHCITAIQWVTLFQVGALESVLFLPKVTEDMKEHRVLQGTGMVIVVIMFAMYCTPRSVKPCCNYWAGDKSHWNNMRNIPGSWNVWTTFGP